VSHTQPTDLRFGLCCGQWHPGDPDIAAVKRLLIAEIPADPSLGQDCAICLGSWSDTNDLGTIYCKPRVCPHTYHKACIRAWFGDTQGTCPECRVVHQELDCTACGGPGTSIRRIACALCPKVFHVGDECLQQASLAKAHKSLEGDAWDWACPACSMEDPQAQAAATPAKKQRVSVAASPGNADSGSSSSPIVQSCASASCADAAPPLTPSHPPGASSGGCSSSSSHASTSLPLLRPTGHALVKRRVRVWNDADGRWFSGYVKSFSSKRGHCIVYDTVPDEDDSTEYVELDGGYEVEESSWELID
jgi:hypothetical protein